MDHTCEAIWEQLRLLSFAVWVGGGIGDFSAAKNCWVWWKAACSSQKEIIDTFWYLPSTWLTLSTVTLQLFSICRLKMYKRAENFSELWSHGRPTQSLYPQMAGEHLHGQSGPANETRWARTGPRPLQPQSVSTLLMKRAADGIRSKKKSTWIHLDRAKA